MNPVYAPLKFFHAIRRWWDKHTNFQEIIVKTVEVLPGSRRDFIRGTAADSVYHYMKMSPHWTRHFSESHLRNEAIKTVMDRLDPAED